ncbi:MAG: CARDB domain-containing protein [Euryarchaeota archaeon]
MRTAVSLIFLLLIASSMSALTASAEVTNDGSTITVTGTETWNASNPIDLDMTVTDGATLFVDESTTVNAGVTITVATGGSLILNGDLMGSELDAGLLVYNATELHLNFGDLSETGQVRINFDHVIPETAMFNITIGDETRDAVGFDHVDIPAPLNGTTLLVEFHIYYFFATQITSVQALHSGSGGTVVIDAEELNHTAGSLKWNSAAFTLDVQGSFTMNSAIIAGAEISCAHICEINNATLTGSAPVHVLDGGALTVDSSMIQGSRTDEDIIVNDAAQISYTNSNGTGGQTDAWIRLLSQRSLQTNAGNITVHATGLGYWGSTIDNLTDSNGHVNFALSDQARIVEWVDGNGDYHQESAEILLTLSSNWGNFNTTIVAPRTPTATAQVPLPYISVKSIDLKESTGSIGSKVSGDVVVENTGSVAVTGVNFWCYVGEELQDTTQMTVSLMPGESKTVYVSWYANSVGTQALECRALVPNVLKSITGNITNTDGATSQDITWKVADEPEDQPLTIYAILVGIVLVGTYLFSNQASKKIAAQQRENAAVTEDSSEEKEYIEDDAVSPASDEAA